MESVESSWGSPVSSTEDEMADDGECDYSCNSASCNWDGLDCFHDDK